jgi:AraC-like DNA-binding protein
MAYFDDLAFLECGIEPDCHRSFVVSKPRFSLLFARSGHVRLCVDGGPRKLLSGPFAFWHHPRHSYTYSPGPGGPWHLYWASFDGPRAARIVEDGLMPLSGAGHVPVRRPEVFGERFQRLVELISEGDVRRHPEAVLALEQLVVILWQDWHGGEPGRRRAEVEQVAQEVAADPYVSYDFEQAARRMHVSGRHFSRLFRKYMGRPPYEYLLLCRMRRAASELADGDRAIKAVALAAGYDDPAQFSKLFKKKIGVSPRQFRDYGRRY